MSQNLKSKHTLKIYVEQIQFYQYLFQPKSLELMFHLQQIRHTLVLK